MSQRVLIVIQAADKDAANSFAKAQIDPVGGEHTFSIGCRNSMRMSPGELD